MKNFKIYPKDWLQLHPYQQTHQVDIYYTNLANRISGIIKKTGLINSFSKEELLQICMRMSAYFEDVVSGIGMWQVFVAKHKELYGKHLPFYSTNQEYYTDEVNLEDVRFLLWHLSQQYYGTKEDTFIDPDVEIFGETADLIYHLFSDEWAEAPENEKMQRIFTADKRYDGSGAYEELLYWLHYDCYLFPESGEQLNQLMRSLWQEGQYTQENARETFSNYFQTLAYNGRTALLSLTTPQWLTLLLPEDHPDKTRFDEIAKATLIDIPIETQKKNKKDYQKFQKVSDGQLILYFSNVGELSDFLVQKIGFKLDIDFKIPPVIKDLTKLALYAVPEEGIQILSTDLEVIKDEQNPFYDEELAKKRAISFFLVRHCSLFLLKQLKEKGMLNDAQSGHIENPKRAIEIIDENWQFLTRYFLREYPEMFA